MKWFLGTYTRRFNRRHKLVRPPVQRTLQGADRGWQRRRVFADGVRLCAFESGASQAAGAGGNRCRTIAGAAMPEYLKSRDGGRVGCEWIGCWGRLGIRQATMPRVGGDYADAMEERRGKEAAGGMEGGCGEGGFWAERMLKEAVLELMGRRQGTHHGGGAKREKPMNKRRERVVRGGTASARVDGSRTWRRRRKTDAGKVKMAARLRSGTVMTLDWIAATLADGMSAHPGQLPGKREDAGNALQ
ncbi:MAG: hypothetical protein MZV70_77540 [Desulfobacterales bacterium]|nr:hypothetical protein [Desulfobacterales bacterium]